MAAILKFTYGLRILSKETGDLCAKVDVFPEVKKHCSYLLD